MNPHDWNYHIERLQRHLDPNHQSGVSNSMEHASRSNTDWDTYHEYSGYSVAEPHSSNMGWKEPSPPCHKIYSKDSAVEESDGGPLEMNEVDAELARKRKELEEIEERILHKKASIAMKTVGLFTKKMTPAGVNCYDEAASCKGETLKDRVESILQQHPHSFLSKVQSNKERMNSSSLSKNGLLQEHHPLKLRVKALMKQKSCSPCVLPANTEKVPDCTLPHPNQSATSPAKEENSINKGFERFLSMLNKGVDINLLSRIVNDDRADIPLFQELLNIQPPGMSEPPVRSESQWVSSRSSLPGCSRTNCAKTKTETSHQGSSIAEKLSLPDAEGKRKDRVDCSLGSSSQSKSPLAVEKKRKKEEEESPKVDDKNEQLQNILKTLGLSLEVEEMSKLADRTQERLYGKKNEGRQRTESQGQEEENQQKRSQRDCSRSPSASSSYFSSSSSSSSSISLRSTSRSLSPSPSQCRRSQRVDSRQRRKSERSHSKERSTDRLTCDDSKEAQRHRDKEEDSKQISTYQHPHLQNQTFPHPHPASSAFPDYSFSQYSHYTGSANSVAACSYWTYVQSATSSLLPSRYPYPHHNFPGPVVAPNMIHPHPNPQPLMTLVNPNLSESEGQRGYSAPRYLTVIKTEKSVARRFQMHLTKVKKQKNKKQRQVKRALKRKRHKQNKKERKLRMMPQLSAQEGKAASQGKEDNLAHNLAKQAEEEKPPPTEEEIKTNLRKKLEAFNQKAKNTSLLLCSQVMKPADSLTSQIG